MKTKVNEKNEDKFTESDFYVYFIELSSYGVCDNVWSDRSEY